MIAKLVLPAVLSSILATAQALEGPRSTRFPHATEKNYVPGKVFDKPGGLGPVTGFSWYGPELNISAGKSLVSLTFVSPGILRLRMSPIGNLSNPTNNEIVTMPGDPPTAKFVETATDFSFSSGGVVVSGTQKPLKLSLLRSGSLLWTEIEPMSWDQTRTWQTLQGSKDEFLGIFDLIYPFGACIFQCTIVSMECIRNWSMYHCPLPKIIDIRY